MPEGGGLHPGHPVLIPTDGPTNPALSIPTLFAFKHSGLSNCNVNTTNCTTCAGQGAAASPALVSSLVNSASLPVSTLFAFGPGQPASSATSPAQSNAQTSPLNLTPATLVAGAIGAAVGGALLGSAGAFAGGFVASKLGSKVEQTVDDAKQKAHSVVSLVVIGAAVWFFFLRKR